MANRHTVIAGTACFLYFTAIFFVFATRPVAGLSKTSAELLHLSTRDQSESWFKRSTWYQRRRRTEVAAGIELRILPLGDSITYGYQTSDDGNQNNGYRLQLQKNLVGSSMAFVGSVRSGSMTDNSNEGHNGATIKQIEGFADLSLNQRPNVILLHIGTNDLNEDPPKDPYTNAPDRLSSLLSKIVSACPDATILVAQIIHIKDAASDSRVETYNARIPDMVAGQVAKGHKNIAAVDFSSIAANDLVDGLHPTNSGYAKMGHIWFSAIQTAASKGWIKPPVEPDPSAVASTAGKQECSDGLFWYPAQNGTQVASGVGHGGDGKFTNNWVPSSPLQIASGIGHNATGVQLVDLDGDNRADYLWVDPTSGALTAYLNRKGQNGVEWIPMNGAKSIATGRGPGAGVFLSDLDNDGKAEYLFVHDGGAVDAWFNGGPKDDGTWIWIGPTQIASGVPNATPDTVIFADINGDGRSDYLVKGPEGSLSMWLNTGDVGSQKITWIPAGEIAGGLGSGNILLADITGDGRADIVILDEGGGMSGYVNIRGQIETKPIWIPQGGAKSVATGDGVDDYIFIDEAGILTAYVNGGPRGGGTDGWLWYPQGENGVINTGVGATRDQIRLADINGDKKVDYLTVDQKSGAVTAYLNGGRNPDANKGWIWLPQGVIATGIGRDGEGVRFADINGDNKADYVWISEKGEMVVYLNVIGENSAKFIPYNEGKFVAPGVGGSRDEVRLVDINGDKRADYLRIHHLDGAVDLWTNEVGTNPANWVQQGSVASGVGFSGPSIQFGSLTSSGRADYIPVVPNSGAVAPWLNGCKSPVIRPGGKGGSEDSSSDKGSDNSSGQDGGQISADGKQEGGDGDTGSDGKDKDTSGGVGKTESGSETGDDKEAGAGGQAGGAVVGAHGGGNSSQSGPETVLLPPSIWTARDPVVQCEPPCIFVLPPYQLSTTTTITFPPYKTTLDVAWLTTVVTTASGGAVMTIESYTRTLQKTVLTIPPVITTAIDVWNIRLTGSERPTSLAIDVTSSVSPPPFQITDDPNPENKPGVKHPPVIRMITPPPFPYIQTLRDPNLPVMNFKPGPPGAPCLLNCGRPCLLFCNKPCLIGCGPGTDFPGPNDPNPPPNPNKDPHDNNKESSSKCSTKTASLCGVECNAKPSSCSTKCTTTTGCSFTDTTNSKTITTAPYALWTGETWSTNNDAGYISSQILAADSILDMEFPGWRTLGWEAQAPIEPARTPPPTPAQPPPPSDPTPPPPSPDPPFPGPSKGQPKEIPEHISPKEQPEEDSPLPPSPGPPLPGPPKGQAKEVPDDIPPKEQPECKVR
ncbi:MAG: hypothetical protein Q9226_004788, partial [Calogaya cf. arnoldii]